MCSGVRYSNLISGDDCLKDDEEEEDKEGSSYSAQDEFPSV